MAVPAAPSLDLSQFDVLAFDAYGTLLDVHSAMARSAARLGAEWERLSAEWRAKQLEYAWVRSLAGPARHRDFGELTDAALDVVAARHSIVDPDLIAELRAAYRALDAYPEVPAMLRGLGARGIRRAVLSNGAPAMLAEGLAAAGIAGDLDAVLSVEDVGIYKPDPRVYGMVTVQFDVAPARVAFFSSNAWDAFGAHCFGFGVHWVNRGDQPDEYGLRGAVTELRDLACVAP